ncbi:MAG TPA: ABC transporter substrate-binding protein [Candidatus Limnocylindrales bacterium]|nr:ABC transporter substrate-binding protein [Candidatus Limnocylindrales bacterium]
MSGSFRRSPFVLSVAIVLVVGACASSGASPAASGSAPAASESAAAPSGPEESTVTGAACQQGATEVKFWTEHTPPASDTMAKMVESFNQANPDICVKMTIVPGTETNIAKLLTSIRGGAAPDVYLADRFTVPQRASEGVLTELPEAGALKDQYLEFAWNETQFQGKTFALPFDTDARALFYNKDMIKAAGEDPAKLDISNGPATIDEVLAIADKITKEDASGNYEQMGWIPGGPGAGGQPGALDQGWHYTWGFAYGGKFADTAACKVTPTDPGVVAGFQFLYDFAKQRDPEKITRFVSTNMPDPTNPANLNAFTTGKLGMVVTGDWRIDEMAKYSPNTDYGFTYIPVPKEGDKSATWAGGWSVALIPNSKAPEQAWKFMQYFAGPEGQKVYTKETKHLPTLKALLSDASLYDERHKTFLDFLNVATNRPPLAVGATYWDALTDAQGAVELNSKEPMAALQEAQDAVQPRLAEVGC